MQLEMSKPRLIMKMLSMFQLYPREGDWLIIISYSKLQLQRKSKLDLEKALPDTSVENPPLPLLYIQFWKS